jgi:hypothetical protein
MKKTYLLAVLALILVSTACSLSSDQSGGDAAAVPGGVYFQDDFSNNTTGWPTVQSEEGITDYENAVYRIFVNVDNQDFFATPGLSLQSDVRVDVDATKVGGSDDNDFGVICRYQDNNNLYQFVISSDGYVGIMKWVDGSLENIGAETLIESSAVNMGNAHNHIRAECIGDTLTLYVNGQQVASVQDTTFTGGGDVGIFAGTYDEPGTDIHFDNFVVSAP